MRLTLPGGAQAKRQRHPISRLADHPDRTGLVAAQFAVQIGVRALKAQQATQQTNLSRSFNPGYGIRPKVAEPLNRGKVGWQRGVEGQSIALGIDPIGSRIVAGVGPGH